MWWAVGGTEVECFPGCEEKDGQMAEMAGVSLRATCKGGGGEPALASLSLAPPINSDSLGFISWPHYLLTVTLATVS